MAFDHRPLYIECAMKFGLWNGDTPPSQFLGPINITKLETTPITQEDDDLTSNIAGSVGEVLDSVPKPTDAGTLSMEFNSMPKDLLSLVIGADNSALAQNGASVTDEPVNTALNIWVPLANKYLSATGFSLKTSADAAVNAEKYVVDTVDGMIMAIHADAVGTGMKFSYTTETVAGETYEGGKAKSAYLMLRGKAYDKRSAQWGRLLVVKASVSNSAAQDWAKGGWMAGTLGGKLLTPTGYNAPLTFQVRNS